MVLYAWKYIFAENVSYNFIPQTYYLSQRKTNKSWA